MAEQHYDLFFKGDLLDGFFIDFVKADLQTLFNATPDFIEPLFNGSTHAIKSNVDKATAIKFQQGFKKAGAKLIVRPSKASSTETVVKEKTPQPEPHEIAAPRFSTALGATDGHLDKVEVENHQPDLSAPSSVPSWDVSQPGAVLSEQRNIPPMEIDTSSLSVAEAGADLVIDRDFEAPTPIINTDQLSLAQPGSVLDTLKDDKPPAQVDTRHLKLE